MPDQSKIRSAIQWFRAAWLFATRRAEICEMLRMNSTPASFAAAAKYAVASIRRGATG